MLQGQLNFPYAASPEADSLEETRLQIKLALPKIPVESAMGNVEMFDKYGVEWLFREGKVARTKMRAKDNAIRKIFLLALPDELAHSSPRSTVVQDLPMTYAHRDNPREWLCRRTFRKLTEGATIREIALQANEAAKRGMQRNSA